jgi:hypothetical protein
MRRDTKLLRILLVVFLFTVAVAYAFLYLESFEAARNFPKIAHVRLPLYLAMLLAALPMVAGVASVFQFLDVVDRGRAISDDATRILRRLKLMIGVFAGYLGIGFIGFWLVVGVMHPGIVFPWFVAEVATMIVFAGVWVLESLIDDSLSLRMDDTASF